VFHIFLIVCYGYYLFEKILYSSIIAHKIPLGRKTNQAIVFDIFGIGDVINIKNIDNANTKLLCSCSLSKSILLNNLVGFFSYYKDSIKKRNHQIFWWFFCEIIIIFLIITIKNIVLS
jgi:hypothetical protein